MKKSVFTCTSNFGSLVTATVYCLQFFMVTVRKTCLITLALKVIKPIGVTAG